MKSLESLENLLHLPSPVSPLSFLSNEHYDVFIKREDLIHPYLSGNKWRKLKYNLKEALALGAEKIITIGGPFSNHLVATAAAAHHLGIKSTGLVRGQHLDEENPTLKRCKEYGMHLQMVAPDDYARRNEKDWIQRYLESDKDYFIQEGGSNGDFSLGVKEVYEELTFIPDIIILAIGTGGTMYGLTQYENGPQIIGISPFKEGKVEIPYLKSIDKPHQVLFDYALSGYGRYNRQMVDYINAIWAEHQILLDPIYNGKAMMALEQMIKENYFPSGSKILYLHTGGLQGIAGFNYVYKNKEVIKIPQSLYLPEADL